MGGRCQGQRRRTRPAQKRPQHQSVRNEKREVSTKKCVGKCFSVYVKRHAKEEFLEETQLRAQEKVGATQSRRHMENEASTNTTSGSKDKHSWMLHPRNLYILLSGKTGNKYASGPKWNWDLNKFCCLILLCLACPHWKNLGIQQSQNVTM